MNGDTFLKINDYSVSFYSKKGYYPKHTDLSAKFSISDKEAREVVKHSKKEIKEFRAWMK